MNIEEHGITIWSEFGKVFLDFNWPGSKGWGLSMGPDEAREMVKTIFMLSLSKAEARQVINDLLEASKVAKDKLEEREEMLRDENCPIFRPR